MPEMNIGTLVGYLKLDDRGVTEGARKAKGTIVGFGNDGAKEAGKAGTKIGQAAGDETASSFGKAKGKIVDKAKGIWGDIKSNATKILGGIGLAQILFKGWDRLTSIENAKAKLEGLGHSASEVKKIMDGALASVKGTAFGLDEAATVAAGAVAAGIKPGKQLESTLRLVADAATIAGTDMGSMGSIFNKVAASGRLTGDVVQQLNDQGIPILQFLGKTLGKTTTEIQTMVSQGKISFDDFSKAMQEGLGGAALKSGNTTTGALKNMGAAFSRFGATLLEDIQPLAKSVFGTVTTAVDGLGKVVGGAIKIFTGLPGPVKAFGAALLGLAIAQKVGLIGKLSGAVAKVKQELAFATYQVDYSGKAVGRWGAAASVARGKAAAFAKSIGPAAGFAAGVAVISSIVDGFTHVNESLQAVKDSAQDLGKQLAENNGKWDETIQKAYESSVVNSDVFKALVKDGADYGKTLAALTGQQGLYGDAVEEVRKHAGALSIDQVEALGQLLNQKKAIEDNASSITEYNRRQKDAAAATQESTTAIKGYTDAQDEAKSAALDGAAAWGVYSAAMSGSGNAQDEARAGADGLRIAWIGQTDAQDEAKSSAQAWKSQADAIPDTLGNMANKIKIFGDEASTADTRLKFFTISVDELAGRDVSLEQATKLLNDQVRNVKQSFTDATKATKGHIESLIKADGTINTVTDAGSKLYDSVSDYRAAYDRATTAAAAHALKTGDNTAALKAARTAADNAREAFLEQADSLGISRGKAEKMADAMGILEGKKLTPKTLGLFANDKASGKVDAVNKKKLNDKTLTVDADTEPARLKLQRLTGSPYVVSVVGQYTGTHGAPAWARGIMPGMAKGGWVSDTIPGAARGEWITGGIPGKDSVLRWLMPGEAVIPTRHAQSNRGLVDALIQGQIPPAAQGGGAALPAANTAVPQAPQRFEFTVVLRGDGAITDAMAREAGVRIAEHADSQARVLLGSRAR